MIWTRLAKLFLLIGILLLVLALLSRSPPLLAGGTLLAGWVVVEAALFRVTLLLAEGPGLRLKRRFVELGEEVTTWTGTTLSYEAEAAFRGPMLGSVRIAELWPPGLAPEGCEGMGAMRPGATLRWRGTLGLPQAGSFELPGLSVGLFSPSGLFYGFAFHEMPRALRVQPNVFGWASARPSKKSLNRLLQLGPHRLAFKGGSGELLEIRDYQPGDSPRRIAWKVSARRDRIVVKELEREVPIRSWVFVDGGLTTRLGAPGQRPLDALLASAGLVARAALDSRDPVGLALVDAEGAQVTQPACGRRHLFGMLRDMASFSSRPPLQLLGRSAELSKQLEAWLYRRYPQLTHPSLNPTPRLPLPPLGRAEARRRKVERQLAAVMAVLLGGGRLDEAVAWVPLTDDSPRFAELLSRFAREQGLAFEVDAALTEPILAEDAAARIARLARALRLAVTRAQDNEVYLIYAEGFGADAAPLTAAIRSAKARHHRVVVALHEVATGGEMSFEEGLRRGAREVGVGELFEALGREARARAREPFVEALGRLGVPVINAAAAPDAVARQVLQLKTREARSWR